MLDVYTVTFLGHRHLEEPLKLEPVLESLIRKLLAQQQFVDFLVGRNGEFDQLTTSVIHRLRREYRSDNSSLCLVLPYETAEYRNNREAFDDYYDVVEISNRAGVSHPKAAIGARNREMVDRADLVVCHIRRNSGGAYQAVRYAQTRGDSLRIISV